MKTNGVNFPLSAPQDPADISGRSRQHRSQPCDLHCRRGPHSFGAGGFIFAASLVLGISLWNTAARGRYEVVEGICAGVSTPMLRRYRKIQLIDEQGAERTLLLSKTAKFQIGARYRFYFQKGSRPAVGNDYLDAARLHQQFPRI